MKNVKFSEFDRQIAGTLAVLSLSTTSWVICRVKFPPPVVPDFQLVAIGKVYNQVAKDYIENTLAYYSVEKDAVIISFAGTTTLEQWITDAQFSTSVPEFVKDVFPDVKVQTTYWEQYNSLRMRLMIVLQNTLSENTKLIVTGHSLGGSLASIFYLDLIAHKIADGRRVLYTFGMPRTGNKRFAEVINADDSSYRVVNSEDVIPSLPFPVMFNAHYTHFGKTIDFAMNFNDLGMNHMVAYAEYFRPAVLSSVVKSG